MRHEDRGSLVLIDRAATAHLAHHGFPSLLDAVIGSEGMDTLVEGRAVWVATLPTSGDGTSTEGSDRPVGFAVASDEGPFFYLHELSVDPAHMRRGIGTALLRAVVDHARWAFHTTLALDTFRTVPFNAPFYAKRGFFEVERDAVPEPLATLAERNRPLGVHPAARVTMVRRL